MLISSYLGHLFVFHENKALFNSWTLIGPAGIVVLKFGT